MSHKTLTVSKPSTPIETRDQLEYYLYVAMQLEHATIPPYLTAAYTAKVERNKKAIEDIVDVAREEMLHLALAANMLNAIGGTPDLLRDGFVPPYPCPLPDGETDFDVSIQAFSESAIQTFLKIERPSHPEEKPKLVRKHGQIRYVEKQHLNAHTRGRGQGLLPAIAATPSSGQPVELHFWSIGEFYNAIKSGFIHLAKNMGEEQLICGNPDRQIDGKYFYSGGGTLHEVINLDSAVAAIDLISLQGEGYTDEVKRVENELAHYYRFEQIEKGKYYVTEQDKPHHPSGAPFPRDYAAAFPIKKNAKVADYKNYPDIEQQARRFNGRYRRLMETINRAFNGQPDLLKETYSEMFQIRKDMAYLVRNRLPGTDENAAPTFEMNQCTEGECS